MPRQRAANLESARELLVFQETSDLGRTPMFALPFEGLTLRLGFLRVTGPCIDDRVFLGAKRARPDALESEGRSVAQPG